MTQKEFCWGGMGSLQLAFRQRSEEQTMGKIMNPTTQGNVLFFGEV